MSGRPFGTCVKGTTKVSVLQWDSVSVRFGKNMDVRRSKAALADHTEARTHCSRGLATTALGQAKPMSMGVLRP